MNQFDQLHRYLFEKASVRGELVRLQDALKPIVHSTDYPQPIQQLLAEMAAATISPLAPTNAYDSCDSHQGANHATSP